MSPQGASRSDPRVPAAWAQPPGTQPGFEPRRRLPLAAVGLVGGGLLLGAVIAFLVILPAMAPDPAERPGSALEPLPAKDAIPAPDEPEAAAKDPLLDELPTARRARALTERGEALLDERAWTRARRQFQQAIRLDPENARAHRGLGIASARLRRYDEARAAYTRYIELAPTAPDAPDVRALLGM